MACQATMDSFVARVPAPVRRVLAIGTRLFQELLSRPEGGAFCERLFISIGIVLQSLLGVLVWPVCRAEGRESSTLGGLRGRVCYRHSHSLNPDPYNLRAEELAIKDCCLGVDVRRFWSEAELVRSFNGGIIPGTPDGMFESWEGVLTCVQVMRVPLVPKVDADGMYETLAQTIITKVVKSQHWLQATTVVPGDFIIFCWLPFAVPDAVAVRAHALMQEIHTVDPRFSLRLRVPAEPCSLFPARFACNHDIRVQRQKGHLWAEVTTYCGGDEVSDGEDDMVWGDLWSWDEDELEKEGAEAEEEKRSARGNTVEDADRGTDGRTAGGGVQSDTGQCEGLVLVGDGSRGSRSCSCG